jgi:hypothetical protein
MWESWRNSKACVASTFAYLLCSCFETCVLVLTAHFVVCAHVCAGPETESAHANSFQFPDQWGFNCMVQKIVLPANHPYFYLLCTQEWKVAFTATLKMECSLAWRSWLWSTMLARYVSVHVCVYVCMCVCVFMCVRLAWRSWLWSTMLARYVSVHVCVSMYVCLSVCLCVCACASSVCECACVCLCMYVCLCVLCVCACVCLRMWVRTCVFVSRIVANDSFACKNVQLLGRKNSAILELVTPLAVFFFPPKPPMCSGGVHRSGSQVH